MTDQVITLKVTGDTSGLKSTTAEVKQATADMGAAGAAAGAATAAGFDKAKQSADATAASVGKTGQAAQTAGSQGQAAGAQISQGMQQAAASTGVVEAQMTSLRNTAIGLIGLSFGKRLAEDAMELSDEYANIQAKIRLTTDTAAQQVDVSNRLLKISQDTGSAWDSNTKLYQRMFQAEQSAGLANVDAQQKALALTDEITKVMITSGATAQEAKFAIQDLSHGLAEGHIQWRQLSAMMRESPQLAKTLADGLGVPIGKLKDLAKEGQITTKAFTDAMLSQGQAVDAQFAKMPLTFARAFQEFHNSMVLYIGQATDGSAATDLMKNAIIGLGNNISTVMNIATTAGAVLATIWTTDKINMVTAWGTSIVQAYTLARAQSQAYAADKLFEANAEKTAAAQASVANAQRVAGLEAQAAMADATIAATQATLNQAKADLAQAVSSKDRQQAALLVSVAESNLAVLEKQRVAITGSLAVANTDLALSEKALASATLAAGAAQTEVAASTSILRAAWGGLQTVGTGLFTLLGGWPGILIAAGGALVYFATRATDTSKIMDELSTQAKKIADSGPSLEAAFSLWADGAAKVSTSFEDLVAKQQKVLEGNKKVYDEATQAASGTQGMQGLAMYSAQATRELDAFNHKQAEVKMAELKNGIAGVVVELHNMIFGSQAAADAIHEATNKSIDDINKQTEKIKSHTIEVQQGRLAALDYTDAQERVALAGKAGTQQLGQEMATLVQAQLARRAATQADVDATNAKKTYTSAIREENQTMKDALSDYDRANQLAEQLATAFAGPEAQAVREYNHQIELLGNGMMALDVLLASGKIGLDLYNQKWKEYSDLAAMSGEREQDRLNQIKEQHDLFSQANRDLDEAIRLMGTEESQRKAVTDAYKAYNEALKSGHDFNGKHYDDQVALKKALDDQLPSLIRQRQAVDDVTQAMQRQDEVSKQWVGIISGALNGVADGFAKVASDALFHFKSIDQTFKDLGKALTDTAAQMVQQIIAMFAKLAFINPLLNSIFGRAAGGGNFLPTLSDAGGLLGSLLGNNSTASTDPDFMPGGALYGTGSSLQQGFSLVSLASKLFGGGGSGLGGLFGGMSNINQAEPLSSGIAGYDPAGPTGGGYGGYQSGLGQGLGIASAVYAGWQRAQNADGAFGKIGGGLAYGAGTYFAGAGLAAGGAALAGGASLGTAAAAGFSAIPVVGWVAIAAMLLDKFSGGNLFGTSFKPDGETKQNLAYGDLGASLTNSYEEKKKSALFGGNKYRWNTVANTPDQTDMLAQFNAAMDKVRQSAADALGSTMADIVGGSFEQRWNKDGKVTETISTVLGKTYTEALDKFQERLQAENVIAQVDKAGGNGDASKIAEKYRSDADQLAAAAQFLLQAEVDIKKGNELIKGDTSLQDVADEVSKLAQNNETLVQTYQRLQVETTTLQSMLDLMGIAIGKTGKDFVDFADAAATAAGGIQNLQQELSSYQSEYYSGDEIAKLQLAQYQKTKDTLLSAIGESTDVSMAQFRADFEKALPTLSPEQLQNWLQASQALYNATQAQGEWNAKLDTEAALVKSAGDLLQGALDAMSVKIGKVGQDFTDFATNIATSAGGLQNAQTLWSDYFTNFYSDVERAKLQADIAKGAAGGALSALGETPDVTLAKFRSDFEKALPTLSADQIVAWLKAGELLAAAAKAQTDYNNALENSQKSYASIVQGLKQNYDDLLKPPSDFQKSLRSIGADFADTTNKLNAAAEAAGMASAREQDLTLARQYAIAQMEVAANALALSGKSLVDQLYGSGLAKQATDVGNGMFTVAQGLTSIQNAVDAFRKSMLLDSSLSPLNTQDQYTEALKQLRDTGSEETAKTALDLARKLMATGDDYTQAFNLITSLVRPQADTSQTGGGGGSVGSSGTQLTALQRNQLAQQLAQSLADYAGYKGESFNDVAKDWGLSLDNLSKDLGLQGQNLDNYLKSLQAKSYSLDDLAKMVSSEVDRIVAAINSANAITAQAINGNLTKPTPTTATGTVVDSNGLRSPVGTRVSTPTPIAPPVSTTSGETAIVDALRTIAQISYTSANTNDAGLTAIQQGLSTLDRTTRNLTVTATVRSSRTPIGVN